MGRYSRKTISVGLLLVCLALPGPMAGATVPPQAPAGSAAPAGPLTDIHDIRPPVDPELGLPWFYYLAATGILLAAAGAYFFFRRRKRIPEVEAERVVTPEDAANQALDALEKSRMDDGKAFYFALSATLRSYVAGRYGIGAPEMTTEEWLPLMNRQPIEPELYRDLKELEMAADPVKYADRKPSILQMKAHMGFAREFIRRTTPQPPSGSRVEAPGGRISAGKRI